MPSHGHAAQATSAAGDGGGTFTASEPAGRPVRVDISPGAVSGDVTFALTPLTPPPASSGIHPLAAFLLTADGGGVTQFGADITIMVGYDRARLQGVDETTLAIYIVLNGTPTD